MNVNDPKERRRLTMPEAFKLPGHEADEHSRVANFTISHDPIKIDGGRKKKNYMPKEQRRRTLRKTRRERERMAEERIVVNGLAAKRSSSGRMTV